MTTTVPTLAIGAACNLPSSADALYFIEDISTTKDGRTIYTLATQYRNRIFSTAETPIVLDGRGKRYVR